MSGEIPNIESRSFKFTLIGMYSKVTKLKNFVKGFAKIPKLVFTSDKLHQIFTYKDSYSSVHSSKVVYKFVCACCNASSVGQTHPYLTTRIDEHFGKDKKSHIHRHLMSSTDCLNTCSSDCFFLYTTRTKHQIISLLVGSWLTKDTATYVTF